MKPFRLSRRTVLRGAGGVAIALPWLEAMAPTKNAYAAGPKRLVVFFTPNGTIYENWKPKGTTTDFTMSPILAPLEPMKNKLILLEGLFQGAKNGSGGSIPGPGDDHMKGMAWALTGRQLMPGSVAGGGGATPAGLSTGLSVDQHVAKTIGKDTRFSSLEFGVRSLTVAGNPLFHMVYASAGVARQPEQNPAQMFDRVFKGFTPGTSTPDPTVLKRAADKTSVLDAVKDSYSSLSPKLGKDDKAKIDAHLANISDLQKRLAQGSTTGGAMGAGCKLPTRPKENDPYSEANFVENGKAQVDMLSMALACDLTRVASLQWSYSSGGPTPSWIQINRGHHDISHDGDGIATAKDQLTKIDTWYSQQFLSLIQKMDAIPEADGTLLDNSMVLWVNELAKGNVHSHGPMCYVIAGKAGGALQTGRYLHAEENHNNLLVSVMNKMGVEGNTFGDPAFCTGPLKAL
ncbi:MAG: DUF1552 domain-containing protein [Deltaproteobacteria bacterium]|nr:DUF1552 domain-containing protein [Deltaproteobacteria bacterium]